MLNFWDDRGFTCFTLALIPKPTGVAPSPLPSTGEAQQGLLEREFAAGLGNDRMF